MSDRSESGAAAARRRASDWYARRSYHHSEFPPERIRAEREASVAVCVPAREEALTVAAVVDPLVALREQEVVDRVVVIDAASRDGTAEIAAAHGAEVHQQDELLPELGPTLGKGDALWRALSVLSADVVCFVDADSDDFGPHFACGLLGPLVVDQSLELVKGAYERPFATAGGIEPAGGGRVTELTARPLINRFYPELAGFRQPLAGELAARRALLERLPFTTGYGVEIGLLVDAWRDVGIDALAQVDLGARRNRHQALAALGPMAYVVLGAVCSRLERDGRLASGDAGPLLRPDAGRIDTLEVPLVERPPMATVSSRA